MIRSAFHYLIPVLAAILLCTESFCQDYELQARIIDTSNLGPVAFSTVYIDEYTGTISDELGFFRMRVPPGKYYDALHISCVGYLEKTIPVNTLSLTSLDSIFIMPNIVELDGVEVQAKAGKIPDSKQIIRKAIRQIQDNYPDNSILYNGYYREYIKQDDDYINLFESIINLEDPGFQSIDNFNAGLMYKRINLDFKVDRPLMRPYDNYNKFVPYSRMPIPLNNELVILRAHDPIRNFNRNSFYFIDCLETDFLGNHKFSDPKLTYLGERPYYYITFDDKMKYTIGNNRVTAKGTIYIDALNYGIKKINYRTTLDKGTNRQKLFELNLEYKLTDNIYFLHYLSFNNLFNTRNFVLQSTGMYGDKLALYFNQPINYKYASNPENYKVFLDGQEQEIRKIEPHQFKILLTFTKNSPITDRLKINMLPVSIQTRKKIADNEKYIYNNLRVEFTNFKDVDGNDIKDHEFNEFYQYREFFTNRTFTNHNSITSNLVDKSKPVIANQITEQFLVDTNWLNTPLIEESIAARTVYSRNKKLNKFIESLSVNNEINLNDILYIHTDREVYAPEDTVWFKTYIRNKKFLTPSHLSNTFNVLLVNKTGNIIKEAKYLTLDSDVYGHMFLDHTLEEGIYYIVGYSSWMKNFEANTLFSKKIMVMKDKRDGFQLMPAFHKPVYFPGDTIQMLVNCYDDFNREIDDVSFTYRFLSGKNVLQRGRGTTGISWLDPITYIIPPDLDTIPVVEFRSAYKMERLDTVYSVPVNHFIHLDFFPEGGYCINGLETNMAFKAVTNTGDPVEVGGNIIDQDGTVITTAASRHDGMGVFPYTPAENKISYFQITQPAAIDRKFILPEGVNEGWQIHVRNDAMENNIIELEVSNINTDNDTALITLMVRGYLCYYTIIKTGRRRSIIIPTAGIPHGIGVITLLNNNLLPQAERLIYIPPEQDYQTEMLTDRIRYVPRDSVTLFIRLNSDKPSSTSGSYSLSVVDDQLCTSDIINDPDIKTSLLLSPEIHGKIHNVNDYLDEANLDATEDLDLLLLTQGWRIYTYLDDIKVAEIRNKPEDRDLISGRLMKQPFGTEWKPTDGFLTVFFGGNTTTFPVDKDGEFSFLPGYSYDFNSGIDLYAKDINGKSNVSVWLNSTTFEDGLSAYLKYLTDSMRRDPVRSMLYQDRFQDRFSLSLKNHQWLEEVVIRKTVVKKELHRTDFATNKRTASKDEIETAIDMQDLEMRFRRTNTENAPIYYVIDGMLQFTYVESPDGRSPPIMVPDYGYAYFIRPENIVSFTVVSGPEVQALYGSGLYYVIDVTTKDLSERSSIRKWKNPVNIDKFAVVKEFYKPVYDTEEKRRDVIPDLRKTIHWDPKLQFDEDGSAEIKFYNGDRYTRIRCTLEGITEEGIPVRSEHFYDVTLQREE